jgi:integrase
VRRWRKKLLDSGLSAVTTAKAYRLLRAILNTAVDDGIIRRNPCRIKGAGQEESAERPTLTIPEVFALADAINPQYRLLVLLGTFASLRWAELAALRPGDIDLDACTIRVDRQLIEQRGHTGNTLTADAGANLRELMDRMGHSSTRAALIYLQSSAERQRTLAEAVGQAARLALQNSQEPGKASGTYVAHDERDDL